MGQTDIDQIIDAIYDAASGEGSWHEFGDRLSLFAKAQKVSLNLRRPDGGYDNISLLEDEAWGDYAAYYHKIDPFRGSIARGQLAAEGVGQFGSDIVPDEEFLKGEYYADFAARFGHRHSITARFGQGDAAMIGILRNEAAGEFSQNELQQVQRVLPHIKRGLRLYQSLQPELEPQLYQEALDASPLAIFLVDGTLQVRFANVAAIQLATEAPEMMRMTRQGTMAIDGLRLDLRDRVEATRLRGLVGSVLSGGAGGSMQLRTWAEDEGASCQVAMLVSPVPSRLAARPGGDGPAGRANGIAMLIARKLVMQQAPKESMLIDIFHLSPGEAAVGVALLGGASAEQVAQRRGVSADTVRRQIRLLLEKSGARNLRDFERIIATLAVMSGPAR